MGVKERIKDFCKAEKMNISAFEVAIGVANGYVNSISKSIGIDKIEIIVEKFPKLNLEWLLAGKGEMYKESVVSKECVSDCKQEMKETLVNTLGLKEFIEEKDTAFFQRLAKLEERESSRDFILRDIADTLKEIKRDLKELHKVSTDTTMCG